VGFVKEENGFGIYSTLSVWGGRVWFRGFVQSACGVLELADPQNASQVNF
jgi:hypothetical protein